MDPTIEQVLSNMISKRRDEAVLNAQREDRALSNKMASQGISGHSWMALINNQIRAFEIIIQGAMTDYLSVAADVRADDTLLDELEQKLLDTIDGMAGGTSVAVNEKVRQSHMPLGANAAEA